MDSHRPHLKKAFKNAYSNLRSEAQTSRVPFSREVLDEAKQEDLTHAFTEYDTVKRVQLPTDRETGRLRGFAFVEMETEAEEAAAIEALNGAEWMGRDLKVNQARPREERGTSGGNWGNKGNSSGRY